MSGHQRLNTASHSAPYTRTTGKASLSPLPTSLSLSAEIDSKEIDSKETDLIETDLIETVSRHSDLIRQIEQGWERLDNLVASVPGVVWEAWGSPDDSEQRIDFVSNYVVDLLGYPTDRWLQTPNFWLSIVHPEDRDRVASESASMYANQETGIVEFRWRTHNGRYLWCESHSIVIADEHGNSVGMRGVTLDVSPRKLAEQGRHEAEQFAQATLDALTSHIAILDPSGKILAVNRAWKNFARENGASSETAYIGENYLLVCDPANGAHCSNDTSDVITAVDVVDAVDANDAIDAIKVATGIKEVLDGRRSLFTMEYPCHSPVEQRWFNLRVTRFPGEGSARAVVAHENITERKLGELALERYAEKMSLTTQALERSNQELARTNQELNQFAYVTSHDLKAPLRGIANLSRWIEEDLAENVTEETRRHLELMRGRVHRMEAMIEGILQYSRVGRETVRYESVDVGKLIEEIIDLLSPTPEIEILVTTPMPTLLCERIRLQQVLMNLIGNAVKYNDRPSRGEQGHVWIASRQREREAKTEAEPNIEYEFTVTDDGPGIALQYHEKVFMIFQTLHPRDKVESTGIGLSLVKKIVEAQGGRIDLNSEEGKGASFRFTWPIRLQESRHLWKQ